MRHHLVSPLWLTQIMSLPLLPAVVHLVKATQPTRAGQWKRFQRNLEACYLYQLCAKCPCCSDALWKNLSCRLDCAVCDSSVPRVDLVSCIIETLLFLLSFETALLKPRCGGGMVAIPKTPLDKEIKHNSWIEEFRCSCDWDEHTLCEDQRMQNIKQNYVYLYFSPLLRLWVHDKYPGLWKEACPAYSFPRRVGLEEMLRSYLE